MPTAQQYLLIQNHGEAPIEGYTVLGYSSTRNCGVNGVIGQFGSGAKHAVNLCLRNGLAVWVYCGSSRIEFGLETEVINDGLRDDKIYHVVYRKNNTTNFKRAGWILDFGVLDWDDVGMALREFISNALDRTLREEGEIAEARNAGRLTIKIVDDNERRAKSDYTRVYVAVNDEVREYYAHLGKKFLHFSNRPGDAKPGLLSKSGRNTEGEGAVIYREGVFVRELSGKSLYDYNFSADDIEIDECRNSSEWAIKAGCARLVRDADAAILSNIIHSELKGDETFESGFDSDYLTDYGALDETQTERWHKAWEAAAGPDAVICENQFSKDYAEKKGYKGRLAGQNWSRAISRAGVRSAYDVLSIDERNGRTRLEPTKYAQEAVDWAWAACELANLVGDREKPSVFCFQQIGKAESMTHGYQNEEGVHIHIDIANAGVNNELKKTALEEVTHWVTGANDNSRDFQNFLLDITVTLL
jgi:hypothetical protein